MQHLNTMAWQWALALRVIVGFGLCQGVLIKLVARQGRRTERFLWQFAFTLLFALVFAALDWNEMHLDLWFLAFVALGFVGAFGTFYQWKAMAISQTRNALFTFWDDIIAMSLAVVLIGEANFLTPPIVAGIAVSFSALFLFIRHAWHKKREKEMVQAIPLRFYGYIAIYSVLWGVAYFGERYWAFRSFPISGFLLAWYTGTFLTALVLFFFYKDPAADQKRTEPIGIGGLALIGTLALALFSTMALTIVAYKAPQVIVQPIFFVSEMALPVIFGLMIFREERKQFDPIEWLYFGIGAAGSLLVGLNFSH